MSLVMEDYLRMTQQMLEYAPDLLFPSPAFATAFRAAMAGLTLVQSDIVFAALELLRDILTHECLDPPPVPPPKYPVYAAAIKPVIEAQGLDLTVLLLSGAVGDFPSDSIASVITIFRAICKLWPSQVVGWLPIVLQQLPPKAISYEVKSTFMTDVNR